MSQVGLSQRQSQGCPGEWFTWVVVHEGVLVSRLPLGAGPLNCPTSRRKLSNCARRVWVRLSQHQLCPGRLCPWWLTGGELCCLLQAEGDGGSGEPSSEAVTRERRPVPAFAPDLGLFAQNCRAGPRRISEPREVVLLGLLSEEGFYNQSSCILYAECLLYTLVRPL